MVVEVEVSHLRKSLLLCNFVSQLGVDDMHDDYIGNIFQGWDAAMNAGEVVLGN